jgi:SHAQKYF class myb-like DNA-binding protein
MVTAEHQEAKVSSTVAASSDPSEEKDPALDNNTTLDPRKEEPPFTSSSLQADPSHYPEDDFQESFHRSSSPLHMTSSSVTSERGAQGENTGRWTAEEHRLFLLGLEQHGKGWKKIASLIKSRTVVQIRTHAQKYFQKLAKARQNGEEGDVTMEGRGGISAAASVSTIVAMPKRRQRQPTGTKRKAIQSVVASAQREGKRIAAEQAASGIRNPVPPLPAVAPTLAHFVLPTGGSVLGGAASEGVISGPALEDSM